MTLDAAIAVTLPLPPKELAPNARAHYMARARATERYRDLAAWRSRAEILRLRIEPPRWAAATVQVRYSFQVRRRRDGDNLLCSLKAAFDGLQAAGIVADDSGITYLPVAVTVDREAEESVTLEVRGTTA